MVSLEDELKEYRHVNGMRVGLQVTPIETISGRLSINYGVLHEQPGEDGKYILMIRDPLLKA